MLGLERRFSLGGGTGRRRVELKERTESLSTGLGDGTLSDGRLPVNSSGTLGTSGIESSAVKHQYPLRITTSAMKLTVG